MPALAKAKSFEDLHKTVAATISSIPGIGELTIYDTALRIGAKLQLEPNVVFLHAGTRAGARWLGLNVSGDSLRVTDFPRALQNLKAREIEDLLCIYKGQLDGITEPRAASTGCYGTAKPASPGPVR